MSLRDVLAELDVQVRGAAAVRSANADLDRYAASTTNASSHLETLRVRQLEAADLASRLAGRVRLLQRAEGDNADEIEQTRRAMLRAQETAASYGRTLDTVASQARGSANAYRGSVGSFGGGSFGPAPAPNVATDWAQVSGALNVVSTGFRVVEGAATSAWSAIRSVVAEGDRIGDTSDRLGISARAFQEWSYVAESTGTSIEPVSRAFSAITRNLAASGGHAGAAFRRLGVEIRDSSGALRSQEDIFSDTVGAISRITNPTEQAAAAQRAFGRAGSELLPLIRSGQAELDRLRGRFRELGAGLSDDVVENANDADQALRDFELSTSGARAELANALLPTISDGVNTLASWIGKATEMWRSSSAGTVIMKGLGFAWEILRVPILLALSPLLLVGGALIAVFLAVEDVVTAFRGGRSVFAGVVEDFFELVGLNLTFASILESVGVGWDLFAAHAREGVADVLDSVQQLQTAFGVRDDSGLGVSRATVDAARQRATEARSQAEAGRVGLLQRDAQRVEARAQVGAGAAVDQSTTITIHGATDPEATAREVDRHMRRRRREAADTLPVAADPEAT